MNLDEEEEYRFLKYHMTHKGELADYKETNRFLYKNYPGMPLSFMEKHYLTIKVLDGVEYCSLNARGKRRLILLKQLKNKEVWQWMIAFLTFIATLFPIAVVLKDGCSKKAEVKPIPSHTPIKARK